MLFAALTTTGKVALLLVAGTFIVFSLIVAVAVPRQRPTFPGKRLGAFLAVTAVLLVAQLATVWWVAETQEVEAAEPAETTGPEPPPLATETGEVETQPPPGQTETTPSTTEAAKGDPAAGKQVFASAGCVGCHTLADAGASGTVGPNLDEAKPSYDKVVERVTNGKGPMPPFEGQLSEQQIQDVAAYVSQVAGAS